MTSIGIAVTIRTGYKLRQSRRLTIAEFDIRLKVNSFSVAFYATQFTPLAGGSSSYSHAGGSAESRKYPAESSSYAVRSQCRADRRSWRSSMKCFAQKVQRFLVSEDGPTAVEYAVMLALIIVVCLTAVTTIGQNANSTFDKVATKLK